MPFNDNITDTPEDVAEILSTYLNPPNQDYEALARNLATVSDHAVTPIVAYFRQFAAGYAFWQEDYNYPRVFQYFYGAYLSAVQIGKSLDQNELNSFFYEMTRAMINYTGCENALICSSVHDFNYRANLALDYINRAADALKKVPTSALSDDLRTPIQNYVEMNVALFSGFVQTSRLYLSPYEKIIQEDSIHTHITTQLDFLRQKSTELYSELHAHYSFASRLRQSYLANEYSQLHMANARLILRAVAYLSPELVKSIFDEHSQRREDVKGMIAEAKKITSLSIEDIFGTELNDAFSTNAGLQQYLDSLVFDINAEGLSFRLYDGLTPVDYTFDAVKMSLTRYGSISVDFELSVGGINGASVSHVRTLESLLGPHVGWIKVFWRDAPSNLTDEQLTSIDYVSLLLDCQDWLASGKGIIPSTEEKTVQDITELFDKWEQELLTVSFFLRNAFLDSLVVEEDEKIEDLYRPVNDCVEEIRELIMGWSWLNNDDQTDELKQFKAKRDKLFPQSGVMFGRLMTIAEDILRRLGKYAEQLAGVEHNDEHLQFDPDVNWQSILVTPQIFRVDSNHQRHEPFTEQDYQKLMATPEFKGLLLQSREARAGIDDWMFVEVPQEQKNLAVMRSHPNDMLVVGDNRAFLYFPDDPEFIISQYIDTCRLVADLRAYLMGHQVIVKHAILELDEKLENNEPITAEEKNIAYKKIRRAEKATEMIYESTLTKYRDHSDLFKAMLRDTSVMELQSLLTQNILRLQRYLDYVKD